MCIIRSFVCCLKHIIIIYRRSGCQLFITLELPAEQKRYAQKQKMGQNVEDAQNYLTTLFYWYAYDQDTYNYTKAQYEQSVDFQLTQFVSFVLNATEQYK